MIDLEAPDSISIERLPEVVVVAAMGCRQLKSHDWRCWIGNTRWKTGCPNETPLTYALGLPRPLSYLDGVVYLVSTFN